MIFVINFIIYTCDLIYFCFRLQKELMTLMVSSKNNLYRFTDSFSVHVFTETN